MAPVSGAPGRVPDRLGQCGRDLGGVGAQRGADGVRTGVFEPTAIVTVPARTAAATVISGRIERSYPNHT